MKERFIQWLKRLGEALRKLWSPHTTEEKIRRLHFLIILLALGLMAANRRLNQQSETIYALFELIKQQNQILTIYTEQTDLLIQIFKESPEITFGLFQKIIG